MTEMPDWMKLIPEADLRTYRSGGFLGSQARGRRPGLLVIDCSWSFCGREGQSLEEAIAEFPTACGPAAWQALPRIAELLALFRARDLPVIFTHGNPPMNNHAGKATKSIRKTAMPADAEDFPPIIAPLPDECIIAKNKASTFFGTMLATTLVRMGVDSLIVCGVSTSGCVRASVVDSFSHGFITTVVADACFDRSEFAHAANLFDMAAKYADVVDSGDVPALLPNQ